jgi:hypothetical protein
MNDQRLMHPSVRYLTARQPAEVRKILLKLRWMGMNEEADRLANDLARFVPGITIAGSYETD